MDAFPTRTQLWRGAVLGSIVHGVMVSRFPDLSHEQSWDGINYNIQDSMGSRGTVTFAEGLLVAAFFDSRSSRNPYASKRSRYDIADWLRVLPDEHRSLATAETLQYLLQDYKGRTVPVVTALFWGVGDEITAGESWRVVFDNGARLLRIQLMDTSTALNEWAAGYEMSPPLLDLAKSLYNRKVASPESPIILTPDQVRVISAEAEGEEGMEASRESLQEIGITFP